MYAHVEDQMATVTEEIQILKKKVFAIERKKQEAIGNGKLALAQKFIVEVCLLRPLIDSFPSPHLALSCLSQEGIFEGEVEQKTNEIKDFQRKKYFLEREISRRKGLIRVLQNEIKAATRQSVAKKKLMKKVEKEVRRLFFHPPCPRRSSTNQTVFFSDNIDW
jgi:hypothetical protein